MTTPRRKACVECRQQKIRCDVEQHKVPHDPCGRCKKMGLECRILPTSTRNLRQTKAEMRRELEELRWNMRQGQNPGDPNYPQSTASPNVDMQNYTPLEHTSATYSDPSARTDASDSMSPAFDSRPPTRKGSDHGTVPRAIDGYVLDAKRIDDCFTLYFTEHHPLFPILDPSVGPNDYYEQSPFLFWVIVVTGSRRYAEHPDVLDRTSQAVTQLAFSSMALRTSQVPVIQGLLILTSCVEGIPPLAESFFDGDERDREDMVPYLPADLQYLHKVYIILMRAMVAFGKTNLQSIHCDVRVLRSLIGIFDSQLLSLAPSSSSDLDTLQLSCARIHVMAFHFFAHPTNPGPEAEGLSRFYALCISVIQSASTMQTTQKTFLASVSQSFIDRTITLAGFTILRLVRSPLAQHLDLHAGERAFSQACEFLKSVSLQPGDIHYRTAHIMKDLWGSEKVFRNKDGRVESLYLRLRTRLSMSVSYDMFWYWREEFSNMQNPYNGEDATLLSSEATQQNTPQFPVQQQQQQQRQQQQISDPNMRPQPQIPVGKFDPSLVNPHLQDPSVMGFDTFEGQDYGIPPMLDQFPDYDWAAGFEFSNSEMPNVQVGAMNPMMSGPGHGHPPNMGYTYG
ncbi:hypothetical protein PTNB85_03805 [Pyrenophora teres f. teres]|nr:hypothetical protein HRS9139_05641 [Pyrenophora teres f. teres]KAE8840406.1 hypothetical protein PTNB85_03805 [Pyrenophora teres f. teres]KAE8863905.1 hypothetical protein PTNB29_03869 [Pyrenophora teres f. teres]